MACSKTALNAIFWSRIHAASSTGLSYCLGGPQERILNAVGLPGHVSGGTDVHAPAAVRSGGIMLFRRVALIVGQEIILRRGGGRGLPLLRRRIVGADDLAEFVVEVGVVFLEDDDIFLEFFEAVADTGDGLISFRIVDVGFAGDVASIGLGQ